MLFLVTFITQKIAFPKLLHYTPLGSPSKVLANRHRLLAWIAVVKLQSIHSPAIHTPSTELILRLALPSVVSRPHIHAHVFAIR